MTAMLMPQAIRGEDLKTSFQWSHDRTFTGFIVDAHDPDRKFVVELLVDGIPVECVRANERLGTGEPDIGDCHYGFTFALSANILDHAEVIEARVANLGTRVGEPIAIRSFVRPVQDVSPTTGAVRWLGGLRFTGWIAADCGPLIDVLVDGEQVSQVGASGWSHVGDAEDALAVRAIDFHIPDRFSDGSARLLSAINQNGDHLEGSPVPFIAFAGGPERRHAGAAPGSEALREAILDRLVPMSIPFAEYRRWRNMLPAPVEVGHQLKAAVVIVGADETDDTQASLNVQTHTDWIAASMPKTEVYTGFDNGALREFLAGDGAEADFAIFLISGAVLESNAIARLSEGFENHPEIMAVYGDVDIASGDGSLWPLAFPAFDYERMLEQGYCAHVFALRRSAAERAIEGGACSLYRLFNSLLDDGMTMAGSIAHLPGSLATLPPLDLDAASKALATATRDHLDQRSITTQARSGRGHVLPAVRISQQPDGRAVTIVIPARNRCDLLDSCLHSLQPALRKRDCEIIVVDNDSTDPDTLEFLASIDGGGTKVMRMPGDFNFARLMNAAAAIASGEFLCLLNNDVQAIDEDWLEEMLGRLTAADVGAVGALLLWPSGVVQHGGVTLGPNFAATHAFNDRLEGDAGYGDLLRVAHQCSAVTAACLLTRRQDYRDLGGMDEFRFPINFNDVDYCLKLRAIGKRIVFTPHARLRHLESASRGVDTRPDRKARFERELRNLRAKWANVLEADPFYSPVLSLDPIPFSALAWPLRSMTCRASTPPTPVNVPVGF
jgi:GT2 family glycosyltransferase